jgi:hypothetical protein
MRTLLTLWRGLLVICMVWLFLAVVDPEHLWPNATYCYNNVTRNYTHVPLNWPEDFIRAGMIYGILLTLYVAASRKRSSNP